MPPLPATRSSPSIGSFFVAFLQRRDVGSDGEGCPPHTNMCNSPLDPTPVSPPTTTPTNPTVARIFFAGGITIVVLIVAATAWFVYRRKKKQPVFPCKGSRRTSSSPLTSSERASSSRYSVAGKRRRKNEKDDQDLGIESAGSSSHASSVPESALPVVVLANAPDRANHRPRASVPPPGLERGRSSDEELEMHERVGGLELNEQRDDVDKDGKWRPIEEFSSFDVNRDAAIQIHIIRDRPRLTTEENGTVIPDSTPTQHTDPDPDVTNASSTTEPSSHHLNHDPPQPSQQS